MSDTGVKTYRHPGGHGYLSADSMFWSAREFTVLTALNVLGVGKKPTKNAAKLFSWLFPLHTFADAFYYSNFCDVSGKGVSTSAFSKLVKDFEAELRVKKEANKAALKDKDLDKELRTIWETPFTLTEVEAVIRELYSNAGKYRTAVLMERVLDYIALVLGFPCEDFYSLAIESWCQLTADIESAELESYIPLTNKHAVEMLNINRGTATMTEISIVFNNWALEDELLINLLPDRSVDTIASIRTLIDIMLYNANTSMPVGSLCSLSVNTKNGEYVEGFSGAYIAFYKAYYATTLEFTVKSGMKTNGKPIRRSKSKVKKSEPVVLDSPVCGILAEKIDKLAEKAADTKATESPITTESKEILMDGRAEKPVYDAEIEDVVVAPKKVTKKPKATKKSAVSETTNVKSEKPVESAKKYNSYSVLDLYATGAPWSYEELVYLVEHQSEDVTSAFVKAKPGVKRSKMDILKKLVQLKQWGITDSSMLIRW